MQGKKYLILGATGGIGSKTAYIISENGGEVIAAGRNIDSLRNLQNEIGCQIEELPDPSWDSIADLVKKVTQESPEIDGAVNALGSLVLKPSHLTRERDFDNAVELHFKSCIALLAALVPFLKKRNKTASIVFISSVAAKLGIANHDLIGSIKSAVDGLVRSAAATYARNGVRVNAVAPGLVHTPMTDRICSNESTRKLAEKNHPMGRIGQPDDIAHAIKWLLGEESSWVTGQVLSVDGGMSVLQPSN